MTYSSSSKYKSKRSRAIALRNYFSPFGNKLVESGFVNGEQMQQALQESRKSGRSLVDILESVKGEALPPDLIRQYKKHQLFELKILYGIESIDPEIEPVNSSQTAELIETLIPLDLCRRYRLIPLSKQDTEPPSLLVAMVEPENLEAQDDLNRILRPKGIELQRMVITKADYQKLIDEYLDAQVKKEKPGKKGEKVDVDVSLDLDNLDFNLEEADDEVADDLGAVDEAQGAPIISLVNKILAKALQEGVSDIHVEPQESGLRVRYRKDGVLQQAFDQMPKKIIPAVVARFKIMADLDIAEKRLPQDGKIRRMFQGRKVDFRVNSLPSRYGEKVCLRILDNSATQLGLDKLISHKPTLELVRDMAQKPFGLLLVTGPTGSGK